MPKSEMSASPQSALPWRAALVLALFATLLAIVGPRHEPWFDEAQAWLIGRDTTLWELLAHRVRYEGTPGLWHALLWLASHAGLPYASLWLISGALACVGAWVILTRAPFPYWLRVGTVFSYFVAYQYAIVARSYALDLALIPLIAASFADRLRRPILYGTLLGLLANANAHSFLVSGVLFAEFLFTSWREGTWGAWHWPRARLIGGAIYLGLAGAAVLQTWPPPDGSFTLKATTALDRGVQMMIEAFIDRLDVWNTAAPGDLSARSGVLLTALLIAPSFLLFRHARIVLLATALFAILIGFSIVTYANAWHAGILYLCWIFALWIAWQALPELSAAYRRAAVASITAIVFVNVYYTVTASIRDLREPYSAAPAVAQVLAANDARVAAMGFKTFAVQPWFTANAFRNYHDGAPDAAYYAWKLSEEFLPDVAFDGWRRAAKDARYDALLLSIHQMTPEHMTRFLAVAQAAGYCKPAHFPGGLIWKSYVMESDALMVFRRCPDATAQASAEQGHAPAAP